ncbi:MAG: D-2-hydroxyacid dehydrogenase [Gemmatimonadaceae bacterium]|nr:D-2-hydroxyacid dehydrogenase [Gemmatimonadaceae bacterium]
MRILVYFDFAADQIDQLVRLARRHGDHEVVVAENASCAEDLASTAEVLLGHFPKSVVVAAPGLRWIQSHSAGMDGFLHPAVVERDEVVVTNMAGLYAPQGGEHAWALLLALTRGLLPSIRSMAERQWRGGRTFELAGGTLGLIGLGGFGLETAKRASGYEMTLLALDPVRLHPPEGVEEVRPPTQQNLLWLLSESDAVVVCCPLTDETRHMIGPGELAAMKPSAYLVCVSRGGIIDEGALAEALRSERLAGAGLDVCEVEPLPPESSLWGAPNLILTPHCAGASQHRARKTFEFFRDNLGRYLRGEPLVNVIDKGKGY